MEDIYTSDEFAKKANKSALILARTKYNELIAPFVKDSKERLEYAANDIEKLIEMASSQFDADANYVRSNLYAVIKEAEADNKRTMDKGLGVDGEAVKEDLTDAGKSYTGWGEGGDRTDSGIGVDGDNSSEEATTKPDTQSLEFDTNEGENKDVADAIGGGPETPSEEVKPIDERPVDEIEETDVSYHNGPVLEKELRGPSAGGPGKKHDLKEETFKWTKVEDRIIIDAATKTCSCGCEGECSCVDCDNCSCQKKK